MAIADAPPRRVVWVLDSLRPGGAERLALRFAAQPPPGWRIELVALQPAPGGADLGTLWGPGFAAVAGQVHELGMRHLADAGSWRRLLRLLRPGPGQPRADVVHSHLRYATVWAGAAADWLGIPHVTTVHLGPSPEATRRQGWAAGLERRARRRAERVIYVSAAQRAAWGEGAERERALVLGNGVAAPQAWTRARRARARMERGLAPEALVLVTVAVVRARKGWRTWLAAAEQVAEQRPEAVFVWVGGGPEFEALRAAAGASRWAERIRLPGPQTDVWGWLGVSDLFLFPSEEEAQPTAVMEAMAAGVAVIASDLPAIAEVLGGCGQRVHPQDAAALAQAALAWSAAGAGARAAAGAEGARRVAERYGEAEWRRRVLGLYEEILAPGAGRARGAGKGG